MDARNKKPRLRFSLRAFLCLFAIVAVILALCGRRMIEAHRQRQLIALIQSYGGEDHHELNFKNGSERTIRFPNMEFSPELPGPEWIRLRVGKEYFVDVVEAFFDKASHRIVDDSLLIEFADSVRSRNLPRPRGLVFADLPISDSGLAGLSAFPNLTSLHILNCPNVTDDGLKHVAPLRNLRRLDLRGTDITDTGLAQLSDLTELRELSLKNTSVSDAGLLHIGNLANLQWLSLSDTSVTHDAMKVLRTQLPNCEMSW